MSCLVQIFVLFDDFLSLERLWSDVFEKNDGSINSLYGSYTISQVTNSVFAMVQYI